MPIPVAVPRLGNRMRGGLVAEWYHPDGARVQHGDPVCRLECDFVAVDLEADGDGVLPDRLKIKAEERRERADVREIRKIETGEAPVRQ